MAAQKIFLTKKNIMPFLSFFVVLCIWLYAAWRTGGTLVPYPAQVWKQAVKMYTEPVGSITIWGHIGYSMSRVLTGYCCAVCLGVSLGLARGWFPLVDSIVKPIFEILRPIPSLAWVPLALLWLGTGQGPMVVICFVASFVIATLTSYTGMRYVDALLIDAARSFGATRRQQFFNVALPACLPAIFTGLQQGIGVSWMAVVAAELVGAREGVGYIIIYSMDLGRPDMTIVGMATIGTIGALLATALRMLERKLCPWRRHLV